MLITLNLLNDAGLQALFEISESPSPILVELRMAVNASSDQKRQTLEHVERMIDEIGRSANSSCSDCDWYQVMSLVKHCHEEATLISPHVSTTVRIFNARTAVVAR